MTSSSLLFLYQENKKFFLTFLTAGAATAIVYYGIFAFCQNCLIFNDVVAASLSYAVAAVFHFFVNKRVTFKIKDKKIFYPFLKYTVLIFINYIITIAILKISLRFYLSPYLGLAIASGITTVTGYILSKYWIYLKH